MKSAINEYAMVQQLNAERCERVSIEEWAGWFEGEEGWGNGDDD